MIYRPVPDPPEGLRLGETVLAHQQGLDAVAGPFACDQRVAFDAGRASTRSSQIRPLLGHRHPTGYPTGYPTDGGSVRRAPGYRLRGQNQDLPTARTWKVHLTQVGWARGLNPNPAESQTIMLSACSPGRCPYLRELEPW